MSKHLCSWAGLTPQNNSSAGKKKTTRISRAGAYTKLLLVQCANAAIKSNKYPEIKNKYQSLKKRPSHKKAIIAIARMLLTAISNILKKSEPYSPVLYLMADKPPQSREVTVGGLFCRSNFTAIVICYVSNLSSRTASRKYPKKVVYRKYQHQ